MSRQRSRAESCKISEHGCVWSIIAYGQTRVFGVVGDGDDSGFGGDAFRSPFMVQPRMVMKSVPTPKASALALKQHTLPSIQEYILPKQPNLESLMLGCNLEDEVWSFNSIASRDNAHFDPSWQRFLKILTPLRSPRIAEKTIFMWVGDNLPLLGKNRSQMKSCRSTQTMSRMLCITRCLT